MKEIEELRLKTGERKMTRLTDKDALYMELVKMKDFGELTAKKAIRVVEKAPTIDAEPVRQGKWESLTFTNASNEEYTMHRCSECGLTIVTGWYHYCPNCGARMDKDV